MSSRKKFTLRLCSGKLVLGERTVVMGVLNVTPDSFSDGGKFFDTERAIEQAMAMERGGADLLDIGGESTRPGSAGISAQEELARVLPVLQALRGRLKIPVSIDTQKTEGAEAADDAGGSVCARRHERCLAGAAQIRGNGAQGRRRKIADHPRSGRRLRQKFRAKLRIAAKTAATGEAWLSALGGHFTQGLPRRDAGSGGKACATGRAYL